MYHLLSHHIFNTIKQLQIKIMSSTSRSWLVAASVGAVQEALKDEGFNHAFRLLHPLRSYTPASSPVITKSEQHQKPKQSEESLRKVMYLSSWGPYQ